MTACRLRALAGCPCARPCARPSAGRAALARPGAARRRQGGRHADRLFLDQRAGRPAAVQDFRGGDRHQGPVRARRRLGADGAHGDRVPRQPEVLGHRADHDDQQAAAADAGADRSAGGQEHLAGGARSGPALVRRLCQLQCARLQHQAGEARPNCRRPTRSSLTKKEWAGKVAIDGTDNEWLKAMFEPLRRAEGHQDRSRTSSRRSSRSSPTAISRWRAPPAPANMRSRSTTTST